MWKVFKSFQWKPLKIPITLSEPSSHPSDPKTQYRAKPMIWSSISSDTLSKTLYWEALQETQSLHFFGFSPLLCVSKCPIMGEGSTAASPLANWTDPQITVILHSRPLLHFLTLILILHSRSQFAFYEDLRNKSLHPTAFYFFIKSIWQVFCPTVFLFRFWSLWRVIWGQSWRRWPWRKSTCECDWDWFGVRKTFCARFVRLGLVSWYGAEVWYSNWWYWKLEEVHKWVSALFYWDRSVFLLMSLQRICSVNTKRVFFLQEYNICVRFSSSIPITYLCDSLIRHNAIQRDRRGNARIWSDNPQFPYNTSKLGVIWDRATSDLLVYNIQLPYKYDHWDFPSRSFGETLGNYPQRKIPQTDQTGQRW